MSKMEDIIKEAKINEMLNGLVNKDSKYYSDYQ